MNRIKWEINHSHNLTKKVKNVKIMEVKGT